MELSELFFKKLEECCKENYSSYQYLFRNDDLHGSAYNMWYDENPDPEKWRENIPYDYDKFKEKLIGELLHAHGPVTFDIHRKFCI